MDEEKGLRRQRRGLINNSSSSLEETESLASAVEKDRLSENCDDHDGNEVDRDRDNFGDEEKDDDDSDNDNDDGSERAGFLSTKKNRKQKQKQSRSTLRQKMISSSLSLSSSSKRTRSLPESSPESPSSSSSSSSSLPTESGAWASWNRTLHKTLLPDRGISVRGYPLIEASGFTTKLLKFVCWTFASISIVHVIVAHFFDDRDRFLKLKHIWMYEGELIVRDCFVFFVVGRLWEQKRSGIDHLAWMGTALFANVYFESQNYIWFLQHSATLFQMHCLWPWELWIFALVLVVSAALLILAHAVKAWKERILFIKLTEMALCIFFFIAPMITSKYFHMHHWYAGWLMGMHFNYDVW